MAAKLAGRAALKKVDGLLTISDDELAVTWTPTSGAVAQAVTLNVANVTSTCVLGFCFFVACWLNGWLGWLAGRLDRTSIFSCKILLLLLLL